MTIKRGLKVNKGKFIVIEGSDGTGKATQLELLVKRIAEGGREVKAFDFPQYGQPSAYFVEKYLRGEYGELAEIGPRKASLLFAVDRLDASSKIHGELNEGKIVVSNRYVGSNMAHQGGRIDSDEGRKKYLLWVDELEFDTLGVPRPDLSVILHVDPEIAQQLVDKKGHREYIGGRKRDLHEKDLDHLRNTTRAYLELAELLPDKFTVVNCMDGQSIMSIDRVHEEIWKLAKTELRL